MSANGKAKRDEMVVLDPETGEPEDVRFDFSRVSRRWGRDFAGSILKATRANIALQMDVNTDRDRERQMDALAVLETIGDEQAALLAQVLADVPRAWLIDGAPEEIDWSEAESLDWIQQGRYNEIMARLQSGAAAAAAKN